MTDKTIYEELNDMICDNVSLLLKTEKGHFERLKTVIDGYRNYIGCEKEAKLLHMDQNLNLVGIVGDKYFDTRVSCLVQDYDGFWYIGFLIEFNKKYSETDIVQPTDSTIIGIKFHDNKFQLKLLNSKNTYDMANSTELLEFYGDIVEEVRSDFALDSMLKNKISKKIGF